MREREREREKERGVHGRLFLGGPCNEVHGMLLVIILRREVFYLCVCHLLLGCIYIMIFETISM